MTPLDVAREMKDVKLGDLRRTARVVELVDALQRQPASSFPTVFNSAASLEAFYRFTRNKAVDAEPLMAPHRAASWERAAAEPLRLVIHDTIEFKFPGEVPRAGIPKCGSQHLLFSHVSLLVGMDPAPVVHGVVGARSYVVEEGVWIESLPGRQEVELVCGSHRWRDAVKAAHADGPAGAPLVHVMDREADDFMLWSTIVDEGDHFVIRSAQDRRIEGGGTIDTVLVGKAYSFTREVWLSRRGGKRPPERKKTHPDRASRPAVLSVRATTVTVRKPRHLHGPMAQQLALSVVEVVETNPPEGSEPVLWRLVTTLPVSTAAEIARVVDIYRKRWLIEEYFRALKTGCSVELRQAESIVTLNVTIALLMPIAVRLLQIRAMAHYAPEAFADGVLDAVELQALRHHAPHAKLPARPTNHQLMRGIAALGGHIRSNGDPGWMVLGRGLSQLLVLAAGWRAALTMLPGAGGVA
jgi:hypothetical protein